MREFREISKGFFGNTDAAKSYIGPARTLLGILKNQMQLGELSQLVRHYTLPDGVKISVQSIFGQDQVRIFVPQRAPVLVEEEEEEIKYRVWVTSFEYIGTPGFASATRLYQFNVDTGEITLHHDSITDYPLCFYDGKMWHSEWDGSGGDDYIYTTNLDTMEKTLVATRPIGGDSSHTATATVTRTGPLLSVGRVDANVLLFSEGGGLIYQKPIPGYWQSGYGHNAVNNGLAAFVSNGADTFNTTEVDLQTGSSKQYFFGAPSPYQGLWVSAQHLVAGNDGNLYGMIYRALEVEPWEVYEAYKIDVSGGGFSLSVLQDLSLYYFTGDEAFLAEIVQPHASVSESGLAFIATGFKFVVVDTNSGGSVLHSGDVNALLGIGMVTDQYGYAWPTAALGANGIAIPEDGYEDTVVFVTSTNAEGATAGVGGLHVIVRKLNLRTMKLVNFPTTIPGQSPYPNGARINIEYRQPDARVRKLLGKNMETADSGQ